MGQDEHGGRDHGRNQAGHEPVDQRLAGTRRTGRLRPGQSGTWLRLIRAGVNGRPLVVSPGGRPLVVSPGGRPLEVSPGGRPLEVSPGRLLWIVVAPPWLVGRLGRRRVGARRPDRPRQSLIPGRTLILA